MENQAQDINAELSQVRAQRDELLAALKELRDMAKQYHRERYARMSQNDQSEFLRCERLAAAAIARAEGGC